MVIYECNGWLPCRFVLGGGKMKKFIFLFMVGVTVVCLTSSYAKGALADGLVAYWRFENNPSDSAGGNHGTLMGGAHYAPGKLGQSVATSNDGTIDYVLLDTTSDGLTGAWTAAAWVNIHNRDTGGFIDGYYGDPADDDCYGLRLTQFGATEHPGMTGYPMNVNGAWDGVDSQTQAYTPPLDTWTLLIFVGTDTKCELFADTVSQGTLFYSETKGTHGDSTEPDDDPLQFKLTWDRIGNIVKYENYGSAVVDFDEVAIWNRTLDLSDMAMLYNDGAGVVIPEPVTLALLGLGGLALLRRKRR